MANYLIIGGDGKEYGPVTDADVRQWIAESRLAATSMAKAESDAEFRALAQFPEFTEAFGQTAPAPIAPLSSSAAAANNPPENDYELDLGGCISRGWNLVKENMSPLFVGALVYLLIEGLVGGLASIPFIGPLFSIANFVCSGPLMGGLFYLFIRVNRGEPAAVGEVFSGFRRAFGQLFLGVLVTGLLVGLCLIPFIIALVVQMIPLLAELRPLLHLQPGASPAPATLDALKFLALATLPVAVLCAVPATYLSVCWKFTLPLIVDQQMDFSAAMKLSRQRVSQHWWQVFGLVILISLMNVAGLLACCVGVLFTMPVGIAALIIAYETLFAGKKS